jgi:hypothetical protein
MSGRGALAYLVCLSACASAPAAAPTKQGLCEWPQPERNGALLPMRPADWIALLLISEQNGPTRIAQVLCTQERIEYVPLPSACEVQTSDPGVPAPVPLTEASVVERILPENRRLVWIVTHRFPNGDGYGPVAGVTLSDGKAYVGSLGLLRLRPERVDLSLWEIGAETVLLGEGESCERPNDASSCRRAANMLVFDRGRFRAAPIQRADSRECIDAPWVEYKREADLTLENGWNRHMRIVSSVDHDQRYVVITEQVDVADTDPDHPNVPARDVRRIDTERFIHVDQGQLLTRQAPLWPRVIPTQGRLQLEDPNASGTDAR